uniref:LTD domain-containing protein n=1 Tax=Plectus sambesii TaxID=2011161 RepID=A0A914WN65_9BILA
MSKVEFKRGEASQSKKVTIKQERQYHESSSTTASHQNGHQEIKMETSFGSGGMQNKWETSGTNGSAGNSVTRSILKERISDKSEIEVGSMLPRIAVAHTGTGRLSGGYSGAGTRNLAILTDAEYFGLSPDISNKATEMFLASTGRESTTLHSLNDRLALYMARIQQLESENQKVYENWNAVSKATFSSDSDKYTEYTDQLLSLRSSIDQAFASKAEVEAQKLVLEADLRNYRFRLNEIESNHLQLSKYKATLTESRSEVGKLQARFEQLTANLDTFCRDNDSGWNDIRKKNEEWGRMIKNCITLKQQGHARMDELMTFVHDVQEQMVMKLEKKTHVEHQQSSAELKDDLAQAIRDINIEYDMISEQARKETEKWYQLKFLEAKQMAERKKTDWKFPHAKADQFKREIETVCADITIGEREVHELEKRVRMSNEEFTRLKLRHKEELFEHETKMRHMLEERQRMAVMLQSILDTIQVHDAEMAIYRTMLEGEERRIGIITTKKRQIQRQNTMAITTMAYYKTKGENVRIKFCDLLGKYIVLENISNPAQDQHIGGWQIHREVDNQPKIDYTIPANVVLTPGETIKVYSTDHGLDDVEPDALTADHLDTWGAGTHINTILLNKDGVEMASHVQSPERSHDSSTMSLLAD